MRSENYAYSIAFEFFYTKGKPDAHKLVRKSVNLWRDGLTLVDAMNLVLSGRTT